MGRTAFRSREFLSFAKSLGGQCCLCRRLNGTTVPADELHHYGEKGMGQKCSDSEVARVCRKHHQQYQGKRFAAFLRSGEMEVLAALREDSVAMLTAYAERMEELMGAPVKRLFEHIMALNDGCAREEILEWALENVPGDIDKTVTFLLEWAGRRAVNVVKFLSEPMAEIAESGDGSAFVARMALKRAGLLKEV